ncbi:MAG: hypothetical protein WBV61_01565 [Rhodanobacteraceae bacterium]
MVNTATLAESRPQGEIMERPMSVTVTCWVIIAFAMEGIVGLLSGIAAASLKELFYAVGSPLSFSTTVLSGAIISGATVILAALMLRGTNWARIVYLFLSVILFLAMLAIRSRVPAALVVTASIKALVFNALLFRAAANRYFVSRRLVDGDGVAS